MQAAEKRDAYSVGSPCRGVGKFAPQGFVTGVTFSWGKRASPARWFKSQDILGSLADDFLTLAPFGPAAPADTPKLVDAEKAEFLAGKAHVFAGLLKDNKGVERVKAG